MRTIAVVVVLISIIMSAANAAEPVAMGAGHGSALLLSPDTGTVTGVQTAGGAVDATGGFRLRDVVADKTIELSAPLMADDDARTAAYAADDLGLALDATFTPRGHAIEVACSLRDTTGQDRAVTLSFALRLEAVGWRWWQDIRRSVDIGDTGVYTNGGTSSTYPLCCIEDGSRALSLAIPLEPMVTHRTLYDAAARELRIEFDLGLSPATLRFPSRADIRFFILYPDPEWGFRAALERYYQAYPEPFTTHATTPGGWMTFHDLADIPLPEDFHFGFHELGQKSPELNQKLGVACMRYVLPGQLDVFLPFDAPKGQSFDEVEKWVREQASEGSREGYLRNLRIMRDCVIWDEKGEPVVHSLYASWARGSLVYDCFVNSDPALPVENRHSDLMDASIARAEQELQDKGVEPGGVYLDNFGGSTPNYRREHWATLDDPLTFRGNPPKPCALVGTGEQQYARHVGAGQHPLGRIVFANGWMRPEMFHTATLDAGGTETPWSTEQTRLGIHWDWCRALMQGKVHTPLLRLDKPEFNSLFSHIQDYTAEATFYAFYPSLYSPGGYPYQSFWVEPGMYERYRAEFRRCMPVIDMLHEAGWQPVTHAHLSDARLGLERYGEPRDGAFYLALYNPFDEAVPVTLTSDLRWSGVDPVAVDLLDPGTWYALPEGRVALQTTVRGGECRVLRIGGREQAVQWLWERGMQALKLLIEQPGELADTLAALSAGLAGATPGSADAALAAALQPIHDATLADAGPYEATPHRHATVRARECDEYLCAAVALQRGVHLDAALPVADALTELPAAAEGASVVPLDHSESSSLRPGERVAVGTLLAVAQAPPAATVAQAPPPAPAPLTLFASRAYDVSWPVRLRATMGPAGEVELTATNRGTRPTDAALQADVPEGFALSPAAVDLSLAPGETKRSAHTLQGPEGFAGEAGVTLRAMRDGAPVGWLSASVPWLDPSANLLAQSDFEGVEGAPQGAELGGDARVVTEDPHSGEACLRVENQTGTGDRYCLWRIPLDGPPPDRLLVSAWSKAENVSGDIDKTYSMWIGSRTADGGWLLLGTLEFDPGTHGWQRRTAVLPVRRDVTSLNVWALFRDRQGVAWFDDIFVGPSMGTRGVNLARDAEAADADASVVLDGLTGPDAPILHRGSNEQGHSLEFRWPAPIQVTRAVIHWPEGEKRPRSSTEFALQYHNGREWVYWAVGHIYMPEQQSVLEAAPVFTDRLRYIQAPRGGSVDSRHELAMSEIEVF